jgi:hypothetical protein
MARGAVIDDVVAGEAVGAGPPLKVLELLGIRDNEHLKGASNTIESAIFQPHQRCFLRWRLSPRCWR